MQVDKQKVDRTRRLFNAAKKGELWTPRNIILAVVAVLYVILPFDLIPEWLFPIVGFLDDVGVLAAVAYWILSSRREADKSNSPQL